MGMRTGLAGLEDFAAADGRFLFSIIDDLQADVSNLLSFSSANLLLKVLNGQLAGVSVFTHRKATSTLVHLQAHHSALNQMVLEQSASIST